MKKSLIFSLVMLAHRLPAFRASNHASAMTLGPIVAPAARTASSWFCASTARRIASIPNPGPKAPKVNTNTLPDDGWVDPDCAVLFGSVRLPE